MNIREQMARAMCRRPGSLCVGFCHVEHCAEAIEFHGADADAALSIFANPSDELVERCARALEAHHINVSDGQYNFAVRAVLTAAVGEG